MTQKELSLQHKITALASLLVLLSTLLGGALAARGFARAVETEFGERAMSVARAVAQVEDVKRQTGTPDGFPSIQAIAERMRLATGVDYIVIFDMDRIRYSHPLEERIGTRFEGGDEGPALAQQAYVSAATGVNGDSVRAFVPIMSPDHSEQVGVVVVGLLLPGMARILHQFRAELALAVAATLGVGLLGAWLLASNIKQKMFNLEPVEIARILEERDATFSAVSEGLIAIDMDCRITVINETARQMAGIPPGIDLVGMRVQEAIPDSRLPDVVRTGREARNQQRLLGRTLILSNRVPIYHHGRLIGALATFRDRTEVTQMAEELTGVTQLVDALRATNHEAHNKLHTIAGLIQLGKSDTALDYIFNVTEWQQEIARFIARNIKEARVAGLLLGKVNRARELGVALEIDRQSHLAEVPFPLEPGDLVLILGNLLENAMEAALGADQPGRVTCLIRGRPAGTEVQVTDNGCGLPVDLEQELLFEQGYSTKDGANRGIGLALVRQLVTYAGGGIDVESEPGKTSFRIWLPGQERAGTDPGLDRG